MDDIAKLFLQEYGNFTIFVVEQRFAINKGYEYFRSFNNTSNYIETDEQLMQIFSKAIDVISKNVAPIQKLIALFSTGFSGLSIAETITTLCQFFAANEHHIAGPDVIDPIILVEGKITKKTIAYVVNLHKESVVCPSIIIILKDNDFGRAKILLSECPHGINVKMIRNSGEEEIYKVINCGADNIMSFIDSFAKQCYSTCSNTKRDLLLNSEWEENSIIKKYSPRLLQYRSNLICDQKDIIRNDLSTFVNDISQQHSIDENDEKVLRSFEFVSKLFRIFCNDAGGKDIVDAIKIAKILDNELLTAQLYRYAEFIPNCSRDMRIKLYHRGSNIFKKYCMEDQALYCKNNMLIEQFYTEDVDAEAFREMQVEAVNNVPGMAGLSHIYNNVGVAYLYCGYPEIAIDYFERGLMYAQSKARIVQNLALETNKIISESYSFQQIAETRLLLLMRRIFDGMGLNKLPFLAADFALNVLAVAYHQRIEFGQELIQCFPLEKLLKTSFKVSNINITERFLQLQYMHTHYGDKFTLLKEFKTPTSMYETSGKRKDFITRYGINPFDLEIWL